MQAFMVARTDELTRDADSRRKQLIERVER
jgi:hypothetical protein